VCLCVCALCEDVRLHGFSRTNDDRYCYNDYLLNVFSSFSTYPFLSFGQSPRLLPLLLLLFYAEYNVEEERIRPFARKTASTNTHAYTQHTYILKASASVCPFIMLYGRTEREIDERRI